MSCVVDILWEAVSSEVKHAMKLGIMQPYLFPYIGYFQLLDQVDKFILLDDVAYINKGWINRNRILVNSMPHKFCVPLKNASQNVLIKDLIVAESGKWCNKFLRTLERSYKKAPMYAAVMPLVHETFRTTSVFLIDWIVASLNAVSQYLSIETPIHRASVIHPKGSLTGQARILEICGAEHAEEYINLIGGMSLYDRREFFRGGVQLIFLQCLPSAYRQFSATFIESLSIIDVLMHNDAKAACSLLQDCELIGSESRAVSTGVQDRQDLPITKGILHNED